jgi:hypothetical protein
LPLTGRESRLTSEDGFMSGGRTQPHAPRGALPPDTLESVGAMRAFLTAALLGAGCWLTVFWLVSRLF